jgi:transposase-like protein
MVEIRKAIGYHTLAVYCLQCGHVGHVDPERFQHHRRFRCRECGALTREVRLIWREGYPPDNVVQLPVPPR